MQYLLKKLDRYLTLLEEFFIGTALLTTTILVFIGVVSRFIFNFSFTWIEEITQYIMLWMVFIGAVLCVKKNEHVTVDVIYSIIPKGYKKALSAGLYIVSACFLCWFAYVALTLVLSVKTNYQVSVSMTWLPIYLVYLSAPVGSALMAFEFFKMAAIIILSRGKFEVLTDDGIPEEKI